MDTVQLWVWVGNAETDTLDVLRYVKATEQDIASQQSVLTFTTEVERLKKELDGATEIIREGLYHVKSLQAERDTALAKIEQLQIERDVLITEVKRLIEHRNSLLAAGRALRAKVDA